MVSKNELTKLAATDIPKNLIKKLPGEGGKYLPWRTVADLLDHAVGEGGWNTEIVKVERIEGLESPLASVVVRLNVWVGEQVFVRESVGTEPMLLKTRDGRLLDTSDKAYLVAERTAFKRAAAQFGIALCGEDERAYEPRPARKPATANGTSHTPAKRNGFEHVGDFMTQMHRSGHDAKESLSMAGEALGLEIVMPADLAPHLEDERLSALVTA